MSETHAATSLSATGSPTETAEVSKPSPSQSPDPVENSVVVRGDVSGPSGMQTRSAFGLVSTSSILTPTPIVAGSADVKGGGSGSALRHIDLKDFEREQDPFENLSLRVINDREELNKVFHVTAPPSSQNPSKPADHSTASLQQYSAAAAAGNVANGLNTASLNWVTCQPVPQWPVANHNPPSTCDPMVRPQPTPYVGRVSGPFADHAHFPVSGTSYFGSSNFQQPAVTSMLRSAKSTPDISRLLDDRAVANARRTPPPVLSDWSSVSDSQKREKVSRVFL